MSMLDRVRTCQRWQPEAYRPFVIAGRQLGRVRHDRVPLLAGYPQVFDVSGDAVILSDRLDDFASRSDAVHEMLLELRDDGHIPNWRDEPYAVLQHWGEAPLMKLERSAVTLFGTRGVGIHLNGLVQSEEGLKVWVGKRALDRAVSPGELDHLVAGGQPYGLSLTENLIKECAEEASIPEALALKARPAGLISYICEQPEGLRDDLLYVYDLLLPADFQPVNTDGEVEQFFLWSMEKTMAVVAEGPAFKFNCALCNIDLFVRTGCLCPEDADYHEIVHGLRLPG